MRDAPPEPSPPALIGLATAVPPTCIRQDEILQSAHQIFGRRFDGFDRMAQVFTTSGIDTRHLARPIDWYLQDRGWQDRNAAYLEVATDLFVQAATAALQAAGRGADRVDVIITVSSTGIATPGLDALAAARMGFRADATTIPVFGWGCAGGAAGLALAADLAQARPGSLVLLVAVELCSLSFRRDVLTKENMVATALFGDGAAAAVVSSDGTPGLALRQPRRYRWPQTLGIMGWRVEDDGLGVIFDRSIPAFAARHLGETLATLWPAAVGPAPTRHVCHPGGAKVITALEGVLGLDEGTLAAERAILARYGNMSAPTVLFVLEAALKAGPITDGLLLALGPGFSLAGLRLGAGHAG